MRLVGEHEATWIDGHYHPKIDGADRMSPNEVVRSLTDAELRQATSEALAWRKQGVLSGEHLRKVAQRL